MAGEYEALRMGDIVSQLKTRQTINSRTVLVLGARTSGLFRSQTFYDILQQFSLRDFEKLLLVEQFGECFRVLTREPKRFSLSEIDAILTSSLRDVSVSNADFCLAELVKLGLFDVIICTSLDMSWEHAFVRSRLRELHEYKIFREGDEKLSVFHSEKHFLCYIIPAFGTLAQRDYNLLKHKLRLSEQKSLKLVLEDLLGENILIIGLDPVWDAGILPAFPSQGGIIWFVNEAMPNEDSPLYAIGQARHAKYYVDKEADYETFMQNLYWSLTGKIPFDYQLSDDILEELRRLKEEFRSLREEVRSWHDASSSKQKTRNKTATI